MKDKVVFLADIGGDIDDLIAIDFLHRAGRLECVVLDGWSNDFEREAKLAYKGIKVKQEIPCNTKALFCGGAFTKVAAFLENHNLDLLVANGFFAGSNIVPPKHQLEKFRGQEWCRSYNPGLDIQSTTATLNSPNLREMLIVSKNVCHHEENVFGGWHKEDWLKEYNLRDGKRLHDLLMVKEGLKYMDLEDAELEYKQVAIQAENRDGHTKWRAKEPEMYESRNIWISVAKKQSVKPERESAGL